MSKTKKMEDFDILHNAAKEDIQKLSNCMPKTESILKLKVMADRRPYSMEPAIVMIKQ